MTPHPYLSRFRKGFKFFDDDPVRRLIDKYILQGPSPRAIAERVAKKFGAGRTPSEQTLRCYRQRMLAIANEAAANSYVSGREQRGG